MLVPWRLSSSPTSHLELAHVLHRTHSKVAPRLAWELRTGGGVLVLPKLIPLNPGSLSISGIMDMITVMCLASWKSGIVIRTTECIIPIQQGGSVTHSMTNQVATLDRFSGVSQNITRLRSQMFGQLQHQSVRIPVARIPVNEAISDRSLKLPYLGTHGTFKEKAVKCRLSATMGHQMSKEQLSLM